MSRLIKLRWATGEGSQAIERIHNALANRDLNLSDIAPFSPIDGRIDLRGFPFRDNITLKKYRFKNVDLSSAIFRGAWVENSHFENVLFDKTDLSGIKDHGNYYSGCSFTGASLIKAAIGYRGSTFDKCIFDRANFKRAIFIRAEVNECTFVDCKLKGIDFNATSFEDCEFIGKLDGVWFRGGFALLSDVKEFGKPRKNRMFNVSFTNAILWGVAFSNNCDLSSIILPESGNYRRYFSWKNRLETLKKKAENWATDERNEATIFVNAFLAHAKTQDCMILNVDEILKDYGETACKKMIDTFDEYR